MKRNDIAVYAGGLLLAAVVPVVGWAANESRSYSGTWQTENKTSALVFEQTGDAIHVTEQRDGKTLCEYTCSANGKDCNFKEDGKRATVSVYFNGPKLVEIRTRKDVVIKRRFGLTDDGKTLEVESMPIVPPGKTETTLYAKQ